MSAARISPAGAAAGGAITAARLACGALCLALLAGCAATPAHEAAQNAEPAGQDQRAEAAAPAPAVADPEAQRSHMFRFDKMSVTLSTAEKAKVLALAERAKTAKGIVIRGYCDRKEVGNAREAAIARATAVRTVFAQAGVPAATMRVRYSTERAAHAAEVEFEQ